MARLVFARRKQEGSAKMFRERRNGAARTAHRSILAENPTAIKNREIDKYPAAAEASGVNRFSSNESWEESWGLQRMEWRASFSDFRGGKSVAGRK